MTAANITIIGAGNMGTSLLSGLIAHGYPPKKLTITGPIPADLARIQKQLHTNIQVTTENVTASQTADVLIFAVKPMILPMVIKELRPIIQQKRPLILSVAAGVREVSIQQGLGGGIAIVRAMPNMPALIGCGATALFANHYVSAEQRARAESILGSVGIVVWIKHEKLMDAVTALSGSGPAYFFLVMEAMQNAGEQLGLDPEISRLLTLQTASGAARMALDSQENLIELRKHVTSPGGTTEAALQVLEAAHLRELFTQALTAANQRGVELAEIFSKEVEP